MRILKGWFGEKKTAFGMWLSLDSNVYRRFHDLIIPTNNGTTQIDHVLVSPYGVFIIETKNIKGWIFGSQNQPKWTQALYRKKYSFQNPIRQTYRQKKVLSEFLDIDESLIKTVIYFVGDCSFRTKLPDNVIKSGLGAYIKKFRNSVLSHKEIDRLLEHVKKHRSECRLTTKDHIKSLHERHNSTSVCPTCGSKLVARVAKKGSNSGSMFLGCESYPRCRFTKNA